MSSQRHKFSFSRSAPPFSASACWAQLSTSAQVKGMVADDPAAVVPDAQITPTTSDTNVEISTQSNSDGTFVITGRPPGPYTLTAAIARRAFSRPGLVDRSLGGYHV